MRKAKLCGKTIIWTTILESADSFTETTNDFWFIRTHCGTGTLSNNQQQMETNTSFQTFKALLEHESPAEQKRFLDESHKYHHTVLMTVPQNTTTNTMLHKQTSWMTLPFHIKKLTKNTTKPKPFQWLSSFASQTESLQQILGGIQVYFYCGPGTVLWPKRSRFPILFQSWLVINMVIMSVISSDLILSTKYLSPTKG